MGEGGFLLFLNTHLPISFQWFFSMIAVIEGRKVIIQYDINFRRLSIGFLYYITIDSVFFFSLRAVYPIFLFNYGKSQLNPSILGFHPYKSLGSAALEMYMTKSPAVLGISVLHTHATIKTNGAIITLFLTE